MRKLLVVAIILSTQTAFAWTNPDFRIANKNIEISLADDVTDGCWTNLGEVRRYAGDKLSNAGANVMKEVIGLMHPDNNNYWFNVDVIGYRLNNGVCIGSITTSLSSGAMLSGDFHFAFVHTTNLLVSSSSGSNLNNQVLSMVGNSIREFD
ncbi:MAG: hypothetical protein ACON37_09050 [Candidatus Puniceispirillaceae bacterium]